jgi:predicted HTH domain antitoxin
MSKTLIEIPDEVRSAIRLPPDEVEAELRKELAIALYQRGVLSAGKACALAGLDRWPFEEILGKRRINRQYSQEDLVEDIAHADSGQ